MKSQMIEFLETFDTVYKGTKEPGNYRLYKLLRRLYDNLLIKVDVLDGHFEFDKKFFTDYYYELVSLLIKIGFIKQIGLPDRHDGSPEQFQYFVLTQAGYDLMDECFDFEAFEELIKEHDWKEEIIMQDYVEYQESCEKEAQILWENFNRKIRQLLYKTLGAC